MIRLIPIFTIGLLIACSSQQVRDASSAGKALLDIGQVACLLAEHELGIQEPEVIAQLCFIDATSLSVMAEVRKLLSAQNSAAAMVRAARMSGRDAGRE